MTTLPFGTSANPEVQKPLTQTGLLYWLRQNLFRTWFDSLLTVIVVVVIASLGYQLYRWITNQAQWEVITVNFRTLMQGQYPISQSWRVALALILITAMAGISWGIWGKMFPSNAIALLAIVFVLYAVPLMNSENYKDGPTIARYLSVELAPLFRVLQAPVLALVLTLMVGYRVGRLAKRLHYKRSSRITRVLWVVCIFLGFILVAGVGVAPLPSVPTSQWGGLLLTFMLAFVAITACFPLGILLALGRSSGKNYPIMKWLSTVYIEFLRGVPLITVFFTANLIVPLALGGAEVDKVMRAMVGLTLFEAAYIAEIVRGGLQALPPGQLEAAKALGLNPLQATLFITLPQALRLVIPTLVGQFITTFKDTSLAIIIGLLELLGTAQILTGQQAYVERRREVLIFAAAVYFVFSFGMSYAARQLERSGSGRLNRMMK